MEHKLSLTTDLIDAHHFPVAELAAAAAAGFQAVHWCQHWAGKAVRYSRQDAEQVRRAVEDLGLRVADVHGYSGGEKGVTFTEEMFLAMNVNRAEFAGRLGAGTLVVHVPVSPCGTLGEAVQRTTTLLEALRPACLEHGVRVAVENLTGPWHGTEFFDALFDHFAEDYLGFCYDSGHAVLAGRQGHLSRYAGRLVATHLHDNDGSGDQHRLPGDEPADDAGPCKVDWPTVLGTIRQAGYTGTINLELNKPAGIDLDAYVRQAFTRIASLWGRA